MYVRFVLPTIDDDSGHEEGVFQVAARLRDSGELPVEFEARLRSLFAWFRVHLDTPMRLSRSTKAHKHKNAISWFKPDAREHIEKTREMALIIEQFSRLRPKMLVSKQVGYVVYEDDHQIVAVPFARKERR